MTKKKLFRVTVIMDNNEQVEYWRYAVSEKQVRFLVKKEHNERYDREPWAYVSMEIEEV